VKHTKLNRYLFPAAAFASVALLAACGAATGTSDGAPVATKTVTVAPSPSPSPSPTSAEDALEEIQEHNKKGQDDLNDAITEASKSAAAIAEETVSSEVPDVVGMTNAEAIPALHEAGFMANEEDASGQGRWVLDNSNWKVCRQDPAPGTPGESVLRVEIDSVKLNETC
jgi:ABC-type glycerol-3-phosphate transport system substrate-binding protein